MNVTSNKEKHWSRFPEFKRILNDSPTPDRFFHHGGMRSPYTTDFDDLHDLAHVVAIVGSGHDRIAASIQKISSEETPHEQLVRIERLLHDLDHLRSALHSLFDGFLRERDRELSELQKQLLQRLHQTREQHARDSNDRNA